MALSDDEVNCLIRGWYWEYWGRGPSEDEQAFILAEFHKHKSIDLVRAGITDHPNHAAFRARRGW